MKRELRPPSAPILLLLLCIAPSYSRGKLFFGTQLSCPTQGWLKIAPHARSRVLCNWIRKRHVGKAAWMGLPHSANGCHSLIIDGVWSPTCGPPARQIEAGHFQYDPIIQSLRLVSRAAAVAISNRSFFRGRTRAHGVGDVKLQTSNKGDGWGRQATKNRPVNAVNYLRMFVFLSKLGCISCNASRSSATARNKHPIIRPGSDRDFNNLRDPLRSLW